MADALTALIWPRFRRHAIGAGSRQGRAGERTPSMSAISGARQGQKRVELLLERLFDALTDPARRERTVAAVLLAYVALWTLYGTLAKGSQDIHSDMSEQF